MEHVNGLDVSDYQGDVDWKAVRAAGYSFAIAKATEGTGNTQDTFAANLAGIRANGMIAGAYHFLDWHLDPIAQAQHFLSVYSPRVGDLPPTIDCEACTVGPDEAIAQIAAFNAEVEKRLAGGRMLMYMSYSFPGDHLNGGSAFSGHPLWVAAYSDDPAPPVPPAWAKAMLWQRTDAGQIAGISGDVDLDWFIGTLEELHAFTWRPQY